MPALVFRHAFPGPTQAQLARSLDQFAELLSNDMPLPLIAREMQVTEGTCCCLLRMLKEEFGEQAR